MSEMQFSPTPDPQPSARSAFASLSPSLQGEIAAHYLAAFSRGAADLLHSVRYHMIGLGLQSSRLAEKVLDADGRASFENVARAFEQHLADAKRLLAEIPLVTHAARADFFERRLQPFLEALSETAERGAALNAALLDRCPADAVDCDRANSENGTRYFRAQMSALRYQPSRTAGRIDLNELAFEYRHLVGELLLDDEQPFAVLPRQDLRYTLDRFFGALSDLRRAVEVGAIKRLASDSAAWDELRSRPSRGLIREFVDAAFLAPERGRLAVDADSGLRYSLDVPAPLRAAFAAEFAAFKENLAPVDELLKLSRARIDLRFDARSGVLRFGIELLCAEDRRSPIFRELEERRDADEASRWRREPDMSPVWLLREVALESGGTHGVEIQLPGAAFHSRETWRNAEAALQRCERLVAACPQFGAIELMCTGDADAFVEAFEHSMFQIYLRSRAQHSFIDPRDDRRIDEDLSDIFPWHKHDRRSLRTRSAVEKIAARDGRSLSLDATPALLAAEPILQSAVRVCRLAEPLQLSLHHDQEERVQHGEAARYHPLAGEMLRDLERVLSEIRNSRGAEAATSFRVMNIVAFRVADVGQSDDVFALEVFDGGGDRIARGQFLRSSRRFEWRALDPAVEREGLARVGRVLETLPANQRVDWEKLEEALLDASITLPRSAVVSLADAVNGVSHDRYFGPPAAREVIEGLFQRTDVAIECTPSRLKVIRRENSRA